MPNSTLSSSEFFYRSNRLIIPSKDPPIKALGLTLEKSTLVTSSEKLLSNIHLSFIYTKSQNIIED